MTKRAVDTLIVGFIGGVFAWLFSTVVVPVSNDCAMPVVHAAGTSYLRQDNPVCRQSLQHVTVTLSDAGEGEVPGQYSDPDTYKYPGRCVWTHDQYQACWRDGGTPHYERLAFANTIDPSATAEWIYSVAVQSHVHLARGIAVAVSIGQMVGPQGGAMLEVVGASRFDGAVTTNELGVDVDFRVEGSGRTHALFVRGSDGNVGINDPDPAYHLDVNGNINIEGSLGNALFFNSSTSGFRYDATTPTIDVMTTGGAVGLQLRPNASAIYYGTSTSAVGMAAVGGILTMFNNDLDMSTFELRFGSTVRGFKWDAALSGIDVINGSGTAGLILRPDLSLMYFGTNGSAPYIYAPTTTELALMNVAGGVGINDASPSYMLDVNGSANVQGANRLTIGSTTRGIQYDSGLGSLDIYNGSDAIGLILRPDSKLIHFGLDSTWPYVHVPSAGNMALQLADVGIGIDTPDSKLHVWDASAGSVTSTAGSVLTVESSTSNAISLLTPIAGVGHFYFESVGRAADGDINYSHVSRVMGFATSGAQQWAIDASGDLLAATDDADDIGASGASRPRDVYIANDIKDVRLIHADQRTGAPASCTAGGGWTFVSCVFDAGSNSMRGEFEIDANAGPADGDTVVVLYNASDYFDTGGAGHAVPIVQMKSAPGGNSERMFIVVQAYSHVGFTVAFYGAAFSYTKTAGVYEFIYQVQG